MTYIGNLPAGAGGGGGPVSSQLNIPSVAISPPTYNVTISDQGKQLNCDCTGGDVTINLPAVGTVPVGFTIFVKKIDATVNSAIVDGNAAETINGQATVEIESQWDGIGIQNTGATWVSFASSGAGAGSSGGSGGGGLTPSGGNDAMPKASFDLGVNGYDSLVLGTVALTNSYQYTGSGSAIVFGAIATNVGGGEIEVDMLINDFSAAVDYYVGRSIPIPANSSLELINRPKILKENDRLKFQTNSAGDAEIYIRYVEFDANTDLFNVFYIADSDAVGGYDPIYTEAAANGSVFDSILLVNGDGTNNSEATVRINNGGANPRLVSTINIPAKTTVELAEIPVVLNNGDVLEIEVSDPDIVHVIAARREI